MKAGKLTLPMVGLIAALALSGCTAIIFGSPDVATRTPTPGTPGTGTPGTGTPGTGTPSTPGTGTPSPSGGTATPGPTSTPVSGLKASAPLEHVPVGSGQVKYDPNAHTLQVQYTFTGLAPNSTHPMHVHGGHCSSPGPILY